MDLGVALALLALGVAIAGVAIGVALARRGSLPPVVAAVDPTAALDVLRQSVEELRTASTGAMGELRTEFQRTLGATEQQLVTQTTATQRSLTEVSRQLGAIGEQSKQVGDLAKDIGSLQDLLRAPKARGGFGELMLERLLQDCLPATAYEIQYTYRDGSRVDAIVPPGESIL